MISSGSQLNIFVPLSISDKTTIETIVQSRQQNKQKIIHLSPEGISIKEPSAQKGKYHLQYTSEEDWQYNEWLDTRPVLHIIGGGYDDRPELNMMLQNNFANEKHFISGYEKLSEYITHAENDYVVIVTFGYRTDETAFKQLLNKKFFYIGLMGSDKKIETLFKELEEEGINPESWKHVLAPVGINIFSKPTQEIAVSIAAESSVKKIKTFQQGEAANYFLRDNLIEKKM